MLRVVFDTVIFVRSLINPRSTWGRLVFEYSLHYQLFLSQPVLVDILEVLQRPELTSKFRALQDRDLRRVIEIVGQAQAVTPPAVPAVSRDPKADKFLATAAAARADYLVTEDEELLVLDEYQGVKIVNAAAFLSILEGTSE